MSDDNGAEEIEEDAGGLPVRHHTFAPRIRAGVISVNELKKLVETAEEEGAKNVKLGGEIVFVWERGTAPEGDLEKITGRKSTDFKFGGVRPVKMCSAETFCRRFRQPVLGLAEKLDELYFNEPLETKLVIGVAGCHRSCSEPATKDVGIIATPAGYDMLVGGSGGLKPRIAKKVSHRKRYGRSDRCHRFDSRICAEVWKKNIKARSGNREKRNGRFYHRHLRPGAN